jgi:type I restriction enzyme S subunit
MHTPSTPGLQPNVSTNQIEEIPFFYPPVHLQNDFAAIATKVEGIKFRYHQNLTELEALYGALSQQAFKGELDLSRVLLPDIKPEKEKAVATEPLPAHTEESLAINLPDTDNLLDALNNAEAREVLIAQWLEAYRGQLGNSPFSMQRFMAAAQTRLAELHPDNDFELGVDDYEHIKTWVFAALESGRLTQIYDDTNNRVQLNAARL